jgi:hypothetical protein
MQILHNMHTCAQTVQVKHLKKSVFVPYLRRMFSFPCDSNADSNAGHHFAGIYFPTTHSQVASVIQSLSFLFEAGN